jgi:hypothetical protein
VIGSSCRPGTSRMTRSFDTSGVPGCAHQSRLDVVQQHAIPNFELSRATRNEKWRVSERSTVHSKSTFYWTYITFPWYHNRPRTDSQAENASSILVARSHQNLQLIG